MSDFHPKFPEREDVRRDLEARADSAPFIKRAGWRIGRRGTFLVMMGFLYFVLGHSYGFMPLPQQTILQLEAPIRLMEAVPGVDSTQQALHVWGFLWMVSGAVAFITAWWPPGRDDIGFHSLWVFSSVWAVLNLCGGLFLDAPRAEIVGLIFGIYAITVLLVSGMVDPPPVTKVTDANSGANADDER